MLVFEDLHSIDWFATGDFHTFESLEGYGYFYSRLLTAPESKTFLTAASNRFDWHQPYFLSTFGNTATPSLPIIELLEIIDDLRFLIAWLSPHRHERLLFVLVPTAAIQTAKASEYTSAPRPLNTNIIRTQFVQQTASLLLNFRNNYSHRAACPSSVLEPSLMLCKTAPLPLNWPLHQTFPATCTLHCFRMQWRYLVPENPALYGVHTDLHPVFSTSENRDKPSTTVPRTLKPLPLHSNPPPFPPFPPSRKEKEASRTEISVFSFVKTPWSPQDYLTPKSPEPQNLWLSPVTGTPPVGAWVLGPHLETFPTQTYKTDSFPSEAPPSSSSRLHAQMQHENNFFQRLFPRARLTLKASLQVFPESSNQVSHVPSFQITENADPHQPHPNSYLWGNHTHVETKKHRVFSAAISDLASRVTNERSAIFLESWMEAWRDYRQILMALSRAKWVSWLEMTQKRLGAWEQWCAEKNLWCECDQIPTILFRVRNCSRHLPV